MLKGPGTYIILQLMDGAASSSQSTVMLGPTFTNSLASHILSIRNIVLTILAITIFSITMGPQVSELQVVGHPPDVIREFHPTLILLRLMVPRISRLRLCARLTLGSLQVAQPAAHQDNSF